MLFLLRLFFRSLIALLLVLGLLLSQLLETSPKTALQWQPNPDYAREIFKKASEQTENKQDLSFDQAALNHIVNSLLNRYINSMTLVNFHDENYASVASSLQLPKKFYNYYLNVHFELHNHNKGLIISQLHIGNLTINQALSNRVVNHLLQHSFLRHYYHLGEEHIQAIAIKNHQLVASYALNSNATGFANANTIDPDLLAFYQQQVELATSKHNPTWRLSLADLFQPLFKLAYNRASKNPIAENIAIIYAISTYVNANDTPFYVAIKKPVSNKYQYPVFLYKRTDQAKHFMLSAVLTITGGAKLADIMGQEKELRDVQTSSGFSFIDLAADRAGMKFSERAISSPESARDLQRIMADIQDYRAFMPNVQDLPEKLNQAQFAQRFDVMGSKSYKALLQQMDDRINALPIYPKL
ncbi:MAG: hypothetical protein HOP02_02565 [Methylococcaceae bacterium]|nr:hypothetical protein [Methylococcaceae bacterium]